MLNYDFFRYAMAVMTFISIFSLVLYVFYSVCYMKLFAKAYIAKWKAWVPIVNTWAFFELVGLPGWIALLSFVPLANFAAFVFIFIAMYRLPICFEKTSGWGVLCIFFSCIVIPILAFDKSEYCGYNN